MPMIMLLAITLVGFNDYPGFLNRDATVESIINHGPIDELVIKCAKGWAIVSYSKVDKTYCSPKHACSHDLPLTIRRSCG
jgi:hypothetical protein